MNAEIAPDPVARDVLLIATRDPRGRTSGRKMVLKTIIDSLNALGHRVTVAHFGPPEAGPDTDGVRYVPLPSPRPHEKLWHGGGWLIGTGTTMNEALYTGAAALRRLRALAAETGAELVVTDMLRTAGYGVSLGLPWIADLDDLLSRRYRRLARDRVDGSNLLGYHRSSVGRLALRIGAKILPTVLRREAAFIEKREIAVARSADVTSVVSPVEAQRLSQSAGVTVRALPMAVHGPDTVLPMAHRPHELVFLGGMDYGPNLRGVLDYDRHIAPELAKTSGGAPHLHVIGHPAEAAALLSDRVTLLGYVEDLDAAMQQFRATIVPEVPPGGIKTKIIVAALNGTLILAHDSALDGMGLRPGIDVLAWSDGADLGRHLARLRAGQLDTDAMTSAARDWARAGFAPDVLAEAWRRAVAQALSTGLR